MCIKTTVVLASTVINVTTVKTEATLYLDRLLHVTASSCYYLPPLRYGLSVETERSQTDHPPQCAPFLLTWGSAVNQLELLVKVVYTLGKTGIKSN